MSAPLNDADAAAGSGDVLTHDILFFVLGLFTGVIGTLIGIGGGFVLTPVFMVMFPEMSPSHLTALSLMAVAANSTSGSLGYAYRQQVHWPSVLYFALAGIPGVFLGVFLLQFVERSKFEVAFSIFLIAMSVFVLWRSFRKKTGHAHADEFWTTKKKIFGSVISLFVGVISSLFGIGGGVVHVPLLSEVLRYPIHLAAGTSHAILSITSIVAVTLHFVRGDLVNVEGFMLWLIIGLLIGAQGGAMLSKKVASQWILRGLGLVLISMAIRFILKNF